MNKKDILEIKKRFKKTDCTVTRVCGCYVDSDKNVLVKLSETFLNLDDDEFYKYLELAKKTLSGTLGNNLLELEFPLEAEMGDGRQKSFLALKESRLKNEELLDSFYQLVINTYRYSGNYLILLFHDAYDVMTKTSDNAKLDESEEVYEYILCAICPVTLSKPGLGYREEEHRIGPRIRDWVVDVPENGFIFPAFTDRSADIHSLLYYTKNPKEPHAEFMEDGLGCPPKQTAAEQKETFKSILKSAVGPDEELTQHVFLKIQESLNDMVEMNSEDDKDREPVLLTPNHVEEVLSESEVPEQIAQKISTSYEEKFKDTPPCVEHLLEPKALELHAQQKEKLELVQKIQTLQQKLEEKEVTPNDSEIIVTVPPEKADQIKTTVIDGTKYMLIPMDEEELAKVNGVEKEF